MLNLYIVVFVFTFYILIAVSNDISLYSIFLFHLQFFTDKRYEIQHISEFVPFINIKINVSAFSFSYCNCKYTHKTNQYSCIIILICDTFV